MKYQLNNPPGEEDGTKNKNGKSQGAHGWPTEEDNNGLRSEKFKKGPTRHFLSRY